MTNTKEEGGIKSFRILCLTTSFPNSPDDPAGFFVYQLNDALARKGVRISVLTPDTHKKSKLWLQPYRVHRFSYAPQKWQVLAQLPGGVPVALKLNWKNYLLVPTFLTSFIWNILALAREVDLILANWAICGALAWILCPFHHKPIITVLRGSDIKIKEGELVTNSLFLNAALKGSKAVVCVGKDLEKRLKKASNFSEKVHHIPNGIHEHFFSLALPKPAPTINILFVGSLIPRKGVDILLRAVGKLRSLRVHLFIVGEGPLEPELRSLAKELKMEDHVTFKGQIPPGIPMNKMMDQSHCLILPSHHEGRPNVILEAMAAGRPVIGSDIRGIRELVREPKTGFLFPDNDIDGLSMAIKKLVKNPQGITEMGFAARKWVQKQGLTWENTAKEYIKLMKRCMV